MSAQCGDSLCGGISTFRGEVQEVHRLAVLGPDANEQKMY